MAEEKKQTKKELLVQFIKFGIVGVTNTLVSYVINVAVLFVLGRAQIFQRWDYVIANTVAFILSVLWSFYWNNKLVFDMEGTGWK
uniref:GtrA family protein n=1 Tax=Jutongia sp. TaxID=2944204 RepID=UPI003078E713